jgi:hypothetical protein
VSRVPGIYRGTDATRGGYWHRSVYHGPIPGTHEPGFVEPPLRRLQADPEWRRVVHGDAQLELSLWQQGSCRIIRAREPEGIHGEMRWHLSVSCAGRHPTWDEIKTIRYRLLSHDVAFAIILPPPHLYVNVPAQDHVFHLHEIDDDARPWETM